MDAFIGSICAFGFNFAPYQWAYCNGQVMSISQNSALFSLLGTTYGGNGTSTFGLPNLQGRAAIHQGQLAGGSTYTMGETAGTENVTVLTSNMPAHAHSVTMTLNANADGRNPANASSPLGTYPAPSAKVVNPYNSAAGASNLKSPTITLGSSGGSQPMAISDPSLVMNFCICLYGIFPSRN